jgi:ABC-type nitrate/sulfonate/bicarbonate transport system substrate-binding protein
VTLIMDWLPWVLDIPVDVAQAKGYYAAGGLHVKQVVPANATDVVKFVSTGKADFGLYYAPDTLMAVGQGAPIVTVGAIMSHAPVGIALAPGTHATSPRVLAGKIAGIPLIPSTRASFSTMLQKAGMDAGSVKVVDPGYDLVTPLLAGRYDAVAVTQFGELVQARQAGQDLDYLDFRDWGTPDYAFLSMITGRSVAAQRPAVVRSFVKATLAGLQYAVAHPQQAVALYVARHPELNKKLLLAQWQAAGASLAVAGAHPAGWQDMTAWQRLNAWMVSTHLLTKPADLGAAVSNAYLPAP